MVLPLICGRGFRLSYLSTRVSQPLFALACCSLVTGQCRQDDPHLSYQLDGVMRPLVRFRLLLRCALAGSSFFSIRRHFQIFSEWKRKVCQSSTPAPSGESGSAWIHLAPRTARPLSGHPRCF